MLRAEERVGLSIAVTLRLRFVLQMNGAQGRGE